MALFGAISEFERKNEPWSEYTERLRQFFVANEITDEDRQRAIFITVVGASTYGLLRNLLAPVLPTDRTLAQLLETLSAHFEPPPSEIVERFKFNSRSRKVGESVSTFIAELRSLAKYCNFGSTLDTMLRDRLVCGINDDSIQKKLLSEPTLKLPRALEIAISMEAAFKNASDLKGDGVTSSEVLLVKPKKPGNAKVPSPRVAESSCVFCYCCGEEGHKSPRCKFKQSVCHACGKSGHLARVCQFSKRIASSVPWKKGGGSRQVHQVEEDSLPAFDMFTLDSLDTAPPPCKVRCEIQGVSSMMEVDTGAPFSLMPFSVYKKHQNVFPGLKATEIRLNSFTKHSLQIAGVVNVWVKYKSKRVRLPLLVVKQCSVMLMGRNWISELGVLSEVISSFSTHTIQCSLPSSSPLSLQTVLKDNKELFSEGLGQLKNVRVHLNRCDSVEPKFYKARPLPYAYREKVDEEIDRLLQLGVLQPVSSSEWATPVVPVLKSNGRIRLCGDFKLTANIATELEKYPLPKVEDLFSRLSGGISFSKIDLSDAYCQLELDDTSSELLVINTHRGLFRYTRLPFGVASAPAIFQREMDKLLQGHENALCYLDDLLVTADLKKNI